MTSRSLVAVALCATVPVAAFAEGCLRRETPLLSESAQRAQFVVVGTLVSRAGDGKPLLNIEKVLKDDDWVRGKQSITFAGNDTFGQKENSRLLVFGVIEKDQPAPFRIELAPAESKIVDYVEGGIKFRDKETAARLCYFFNYLDSPEILISTDAFQQIGATSYEESREAYTKLPAKTLVKLLRDPNTPPERLALYGLILAHCGNARDHVPLLREMFKDLAKRNPTDMRRILTGYLILDPAAGREYIRELLADPRQDFLLCYGALQTLRFCRDQRPDLIPEKEIVANVMRLALKPDTSDLAIEDLRRWQRWELNSTILSLYGRKSHDIPLVKRTIIRFALAAPAENREAEEFVNRLREQMPDRIREIEEQLESEAIPAKRDTLP